MSGSTQGITTDCTDCVVDAKSLADTLEASGRTWKTYAEGLPAPGFLGAFNGRYAKKHNPFAYFRGIAEDPARRARLVPLSQLGPDVRAGALPSFSLVVPDLCHSMHDCSVAVGDAWLRGQIGKFVKLPNTVVFVVFDEGSTGIRGGGHTAGPGNRAGRPPRVPVRRGDGPLRDPAHDRAGVGAAAARALRARRADHRHLALMPH